MNKLKPFLLLALLPFVATACAVLPIGGKPRYSPEKSEAFRKGDFAVAAAELEDGATQPGPDRLVFLLERAQALHALGRYERSNQLLLEADRIAASEPLSGPEKLRAGKIPNIRETRYLGEEFESVLIPVFAALNFALLGRDSDAINEARRAEMRLAEYQRAGGRTYGMPAFLRYFTAFLYERQRSYPAARGDFAAASQLRGGAELPISLDLARIAVRAGEHSEAESLPGIDPKRLASVYREVRDMGFALVVFENDFISAKLADGDFPEIPVLGPPRIQAAHAAVFVDGEEVGRTVPLFDIDLLARENFAAKRSLSQADKVAGQGGYRGHERAVKLSADLRHWSTLPANLQLARIPLRPGIHRVMLRLDAGNGRRGPFRDLGEVEIKAPGEVKLLAYRSLDHW